MDTKYLNDPDTFPEFTDDPIALDMLRALGEVIMARQSDPGVGFAVYRVQHDGWRISRNKDEQERWDVKFGKGKRDSQIKRAMDILCEHNVLASWEWVNYSLSEQPVFHILPGYKWGDIQKEQEKREKDRANKRAIGRMERIQECREQVRRSRAEVHRAKQALLLEDIPALVEYLKGVDPDASVPDRSSWDTVDRKVANTIREMERSMRDRERNEEWMQRVMQAQD
jgi:hypothetical protein